MERHRDSPGPGSRARDGCRRRVVLAIPDLVAAVEAQRPRRSANAFISAGLGPSTTVRTSSSYGDRFVLKPWSKGFISTGAPFWDGFVPDSGTNPYPVGGPQPPPSPAQALEAVVDASHGGLVLPLPTGIPTPDRRSSGPAETWPGEERGSHGRMVSGVHHRRRITCRKRAPNRLTRCGSIRLASRRCRSVCRARSGRPSRRRRCTAGCRTSRCCRWSRRSGPTCGRTGRSHRSRRRRCPPGRTRRR